MNSPIKRYKGNLIRVEDCARETNLYIAESNIGCKFDIKTDPINYPLTEIEKKWGTHRFDMRITPLNGEYYICHAVWLRDLGCCSAIAKTNDFIDFESIGSMSIPPNRNRKHY